MIGPLVLTDKVCAAKKQLTVMGHTTLEQHESLRRKTSNGCLVNEQLGFLGKSQIGDIMYAERKKESWQGSVCEKTLGGGWRWRVKVSARPSASCSRNLGICSPLFHQTLITTATEIANAKRKPCKS